MKIVLVFPPFYLEPMYNLPPLGIINLASSLKETGHELKLMDLVLAIRQKSLNSGKHIYQDCAAVIMEQCPDVVGFSAQCTTYPSVIQISRILREKRPDIRIVLGGHNASFIDEETLNKFPFIDSIVRGEGEITFEKLVNSYEKGGNGEDVPGVTYISSGKIFKNQDRELVSDLDSLPFPDYSVLPSLSDYRDACGLPRSIAILEVGRGCPHRCIYCSESIMWRRKCRTFSVPRLVNEMKNLSTNFDAECFLLAYDQFTSNRAFVERFCNAVIAEGLNHLPWYCISRLDSVDSSLLELMKDAGCESMCYGIDSGSKKTLSFIRKSIDREILYQRVTETADQGIVPTLSFIIGFPEEQKEDINETLLLAIRAGIVGNNNPLIQMPTVLPGTDLHARYHENLVRRVDTYFAMGLEFDNGRRLESDERLIDSDPFIFSSFYNLLCPGLSLENLNLIATYFPMTVQFFPKTFLLLSRTIEETITDLFLRWFAWINRLLKRKDRTNLPQDYYLYFKDFVSDTLKQNKKVTISHLNDILRYENAALEAAKFSEHEAVFSINVNDIRQLKPIKSKKILIKRFDFDISVIIFDLKEGLFNNSYQEEETLLVFKHDNNILDVSEINDFTYDFLQLCDGNTPMDFICTKLFSSYGKIGEKNEFFNSCMDSALFLGEIGFIKSR